jgi:hypothetical protein
METGGVVGDGVRGQRALAVGIGSVRSVRLRCHLMLHVFGWAQTRLLGLGVRVG